VGVRYIAYNKNPNNMELCMDESDQQTRHGIKGLLAGHHA
jgi:hypothetical protein